MDEIVFCEKVNRYDDMVYRIAYTYLRNRQDAEDVSQEVFLKLYMTDKEFLSLEKEKAWIIRVTLNRCKDLKKSVWWSRRTQQNEIISTEVFDRPEESELYAAVFNLPEKYRVIMLLYYYENYSINEISEITQRNASTIRTQLERTRTKLKKLLTGKDECYYERNKIQKYDGKGQNV